MNYNSIAEILESGTTNMTVIRNNSKQDDGVDTITGVSWFNYNGTTISNLYVSGNSFIGLGSNSEHLKINRRDCALWYLYREEGTLYNYYRFLKIRWQGYSQYSSTSSSYLLQYDVIFWDTGDISLHMINIPTSSNNGTYSFNNVNYVVSSDSPNITFRVTDTGYDIVNELYFLPEPYDRKYIIRENEIFYTIVDDCLTAISNAELNAELFKTYGVDEINTEIICSLTNPEILYWQDSADILPEKVALLTAVPNIQVITTDKIYLTHNTIKGIESFKVDYDGNISIAVNFEDTGWKSWNGTEWVVLSDNYSGMSKETIETITMEQWNLLYENSTYFRIRFSLATTEDILRSIYVDFAN